jgi:DNA (cytosine-5)-methyltransferase 1
VFVVGHLGNWQRAAAVLFERHSLQGHPAPSREKGQNSSTFFESSLAQYRAENVGGTLKASGGVLGGGSETFVANTLTAGIGRRNDVESDTFAVEPMAWDSEMNPSVNVAGTLLRGGQGGRQDGICQLTYGIPGNWIGRQPENGGNAVEPMHDVSPCLTKTDRHGVAAMQVRRLTPVECERLQGFPDGYTNIPWRNKPESPDGPRYKAMGNSMAVPVMRWIGERIAAVEAL